MAEETIKSKLEELVTHSRELGDTAYKIAKINAIRKTANISATLIYSIIAAALFTFVLLFISVAAAWWLGDILHSRALGFVAIAAFYLLFFLLIVLLKGKSILPFFRNKIVSKIYE